MLGLARAGRPDFGQTLCIRQGRHPIHEAIAAGTPFVPNDTFCNAASNFHIITGTNMVSARACGTAARRSSRALHAAPALSEPVRSLLRRAASPRT